MSPYRSKRQWRWAFATGQDFAHRWAKQTSSYKRLPAKKKASKGKRKK